MGAKTFKHVGVPSKAKTFYDNNIFGKDCKPIQDLAMLAGHNRFATRGEINTKNAHPFIAGKIVGSHNGTIDDRVLERLGKNPYETDSEFLYNKFNEIGVEDTIKELDGGAWALTWYNTEDKTLNFLRNYKRPLFIAENNFGTIAWASEQWMLETAFNLNNTHGYTIQELTPNKWISVSLKDKDKAESKEVRAEVRSNFTHGGTTSVIVSTIKQKDSSATTSDDDKPKCNVVSLAAARRVRDKNVELLPVKVEKDSTGKEYLACIIDDILGDDMAIPNVRVRIYLTEKNREDLKEWSVWPYTDNGEPEFYCGKIKNVKWDRAIGSFYALLDLRTLDGPYFYDASTVKDVDPVGESEAPSSTEEEDDNDPNGVAYVFNNRMVDRDEWETKTWSACVHCNSIPEWRDRKKLFWVDPNSFFCDECTEDEVYKQYGIDPK